MKHKGLATIYIVRHGETTSNIRRIIRGHSDSWLTKKGREDSQKLADKLKDITFDKVFSSDLVRARRTAEIIVLEKKLAIETTKALREQNFGRFEGVSFSKFNKLFKIWGDLSDKEKYVYKLADDMESIEETVSRFITFLREVAVAYAGKTVLVVCHGNLMRYLMIHLGQATYEGFWAFENNGYVQLESDGIDFFIKKTEGFRNFDS